MKLCSSLFVINKASCLENKESRNMNNDKDLKFFGGYRHLGYLNKKPLIAKYILEKDNFVAKAPCISNEMNEILSSNAFRGFGSGINVNNCNTTRTCGEVKK